VFNGKWTWEEFSDAQRESNQLLATVDHAVYIIGNLQSGPNLPANALSAYRGFLEHSAENMGLIVLVGSSNFVKAMVGIFTRLMPNKVPGADFTFATTVRDAYALIAQHDQNRPVNTENGIR
jgi:hypothetical protein